MKSGKNNLVIRMYCECGGIIDVTCQGIGEVGMVTGVPCNKCERTYTFKWVKDSPVVKGQYEEDKPK